MNRFTSTEEGIEFPPSDQEMHDPEVMLLTTMAVAEQSGDDPETRKAAVQELRRRFVGENTSPMPVVGDSPLKRKHLEYLAKSAGSSPRRTPGQVWRGQSGRYFTMTQDRRVVPYKGNDGGPSNKPPSPKEAQEANSQHLKAKKTMLEKLTKLAGDVSGKAAEVYKKITVGAMRKMSPEARKKLRTVAKYAAAVEHQLERFTTSTQAMVGQVVKESNLPPEQQETVMKIVKTVDLAMRWSVNIVASKEALVLAGASGGASFALSKVGYYIPVASLAYLAASTAVDPMATIRAAKKMLTGKKEGKAAGASGLDAQFVGALCELYKQHDPELVNALVSVAVDEEHDPGKAMAAVQQALERGGAATFPKIRPSPFVQKYLQIELKKVSGRRQDSLGRTICYSDGRRVSCGDDVSSDREISKPHKTESESQSSGPSNSENRNPDAKPPSLPEKFVPPKPMGANKAPKNAEGKPSKGYTASGMTNTSFGDMIESFTKQLGFRSILPEGRRSNKDVKLEGSSIDVEYDHSGYAMEVKAVCVEATEYKAKPKKDEVEGKVRFAKMHGLKPAMMIIVTSVTEGKAWAYWRDGIGAYALNPDNLNDWNYAGEITFDKPKEVT